MYSRGSLNPFWNHDVLNFAHHTFHLNLVTMDLEFQDPIRNQRHLCLVKSKHKHHNGKHNILKVT